MCMREEFMFQNFFVATSIFEVFVVHHKFISHCKCYMSLHRHGCQLQRRSGKQPRGGNSSFFKLCNAANELSFIVNISKLLNHRQSSCSFGHPHITHNLQSSKINHCPRHFCDRNKIHKAALYYNPSGWTGPVVDYVVS